MRTQTAASLVLLAVAGVAGVRSAAAEIHFTTPPPTLEQALAAAKEAGKPLVVELSATWCAPCQMVATDLEKPAAKPLLGGVHFVVYDASGDELGQAVKDRLRVVALPTLVAFDSSAPAAPMPKELGRTTGYDSWKTLARWLRSVTTMSLTLDQMLARAAAAPKDGALQLEAAHRLFETKQYDKARKYLGAAQTAGPKEVTADAAWSLMQLRYTDLMTARGQAETIKLATQYPGTDAAANALKYLAALPKPPLQTLETLLPKHLAALTDTEAYADLAYTAMKAGANQAARQIATRIEGLGKEHAPALGALAEIAFTVEGDAKKALALAERALARASGVDRKPYLQSQERYRRNQKEPADAVQRFEAPELELRHDSQLPDFPAMPAWMLARSTVSKALTESCSEAAAAAVGELRAIVLTADKPDAHHVQFPKCVDASWSACAAKTIRQVSLAPGLALDVVTLGLSKDVERSLSKLKSRIESACVPYARTQDVGFLLVAEPKNKPTLSFPKTGVMSPELVSCIEKGFAELRVNRAVTQAVSLHFLGVP